MQPFDERDRKETWKKGKKLIDLKKGDLVYIQKTINGFMYSYECEFLAYERGNVKARVLRYYPQWIKPQTDLITTKPTSCYLWGKGGGASWAHCHWCKNGEFV